MPENTVAAMKYALGLGCTLKIVLSCTKNKDIIFVEKGSPLEPAGLIGPVKLLTGNR